MSIEKLDFSLRLRHEDADLVPIARRLNLEPSIAWKKDDQRALPDGTRLAGTRDSSYCSIDPSVHDVTDLDTGLGKCLEVLVKKSPRFALVCNGGRCG
jgi:hypothetical protein